MTASTYRVISKEEENHIFSHNWIFRDTCIYMQPTLTKKWNYIFVQILCSYFQLFISDTLVGYFLDVLFLLLAVILSEFHKKPRRKYWVTEKGT